MMCIVSIITFHFTHYWVEKEIHTDITVSVDEPFIMAKEAKQHVEKGFQTLKIKVGKSAHLDLERIEAIRNSVPKIRRYD